MNDPEPLPESVRVLTVKQPWAWAIVNGHKLVENRTARWSYRGPLLIHASAAWSPRGEQSPLVRQAWQNATGAEGPPRPQRIEGTRWLAPGGRTASEHHTGATWFGQIVGLVDLVAAPNAPW